jgi:hypothetical protein
VRERAAYDLGWQRGSADGRAAVLRSQAPGQSKRAQRVDDQVRALVVNDVVAVTQERETPVEVLGRVMRVDVRIPRWAVGAVERERRQASIA